MKRFTAILLALIMMFSLCACGVNPDETGNPKKFTTPTEVTAPDGSVIYSDSSIIEYPQTGEYKETALLTNVPGQGVPLLLDMREDGTIDYIFASTEGYNYGSNRQQLSFQDNGVKFYTIAPDGSATLHDGKWVEEIDHYVETTTSSANIKNGKWIFHFAAEEGTVLILGQYGPNLYDIKEMLVTVLFKVQNDQVTIVPIDYGVEFKGESVNWGTAYITELRLENGYVLFENRSANLQLTKKYQVMYAVYQLNGTLSDIKAENDIDKLGNSLDGYGTTSTVISVDTDGKLYSEEVSRSHQYTEDDTLYCIGKQHPRYDNVAYGTGKDFCCWLNEAGQGVLMCYTYAPEGKIDPEVLTVWSLEPNDVIAAAVAQWNHTHASPIFRYETAAEEMESSNLTEEDILTRLNLELLNNQGPDVMVLDGLDVDNYIQFMAPLDRLDTDGVYSSILDPFTVGEDLLALPTRTVPYLLGRLTEGTQKIESLEAFADLVTTSTGVLQVPNIYILELYSNYVYGTALYYVYHFDQVFRQWYPAWADAIWEGGKLNKEVFAEFMTQTTRLVDHYTLQEYDPQLNLKPGAEAEEGPDNAFYPIMDETDFLDKKNHALYTLTAPGYVGLETYWKVDPGYSTPSKIIPHYIESIPGPDGSGVMIPLGITGIRAGGNEEAGQEFMQILLSREMQLSGSYHDLYYLDTGSGYPVIWDYTEDLIAHNERLKNQECAVQNNYEETIADLRTVIIDEYLFEAALVTARNCYRTEDRLTPEEAAEALYEATRIYLAEKR